MILAASAAASDITFRAEFRHTGALWSREQSAIIRAVPANLPVAVALEQNLRRDLLVERGVILGIAPTTARVKSVKTMALEALRLMALPGLNVANGQAAAILWHRAGVMLGVYH